MKKEIQFEAKHGSTSIYTTLSNYQEAPGVKHKTHKKAREAVIQHHKNKKIKQP